MIDMDNTFIGFGGDSSKAYCKRCDHLFVYYWNGCKPETENAMCPKCHKHDNVVSEHNIGISLLVLEHMTDSKLVLHRNVLKNELELLKNIQLKLKIWDGN